MKSRRVAMAMACMVSAAFLTGCPTVVAPFDATGDYVGTWDGTATLTSTAGTTPIAVADGPITVGLLHEPDLPLINMEVVGFVEVDWDYLLGPLASFIDLSGFDVPIPILGSMQEDGSMSLSLSGCPEGLGVCGSVTLDGTGVDTDADGEMDEFSGTFSLQLTVGELTVELQGTLDVASAPEE